ncbi:hypothetical protein RFI_27464 [Reticulomyxa filosa]|uniref:Uncharacterized protein n=1 Tax=Reticulomyxa filosa TaxID=46433 RepID=X6M7M9_RETFI|nr:hypothetical protein RFI_27464 [Reticulomyxa filosa]|eukprot:ETO09909.1 hypothetical protein RFI_27464 [Reticulomyxa filosa]
MLPANITEQEAGYNCKPFEEASYLKFSHPSRFIHETATSINGTPYFRKRKRSEEQSPVLQTDQPSHDSVEALERNFSKLHTGFCQLASQLFASHSPVQVTTPCLPQTESSSHQAHSNSLSPPYSKFIYFVYENTSKLYQKCIKLTIKLFFGFNKLYFQSIFHLTVYWLPRLCHNKIQSIVVHKQNIGGKPHVHDTNSKDSQQLSQISSLIDQRLQNLRERLQKLEAEEQIETTFVETYSEPTRFNCCKENVEPNLSPARQQTSNFKASSLNLAPNNNVIEPVHLLKSANSTADNRAVTSHQINNDFLSRKPTSIVEGISISNEKKQVSTLDNNQRKDTQLLSFPKQNISPTINQTVTTMLLFNVKENRRFMSKSIISNQLWNEIAEEKLQSDISNVLTESRQQISSWFELHTDKQYDHLHKINDVRAAETETAVLVLFYSFFLHECDIISFTILIFGNKA